MNSILRYNTKYNLRSLDRVNYDCNKRTHTILKNREKSSSININYIKDTLKNKLKSATGNSRPLVNNIWLTFNKYHSIQHNTVSDDTDDNNYNFKKDYVSATSVKNHLLDDPILDWLEKYYLTLGFNEHENTHNNYNINSIIDNNNHKKEQINNEFKQLSILFEMGLKFESAVIDYIRAKFPSNAIKKVANSKCDIVPESMIKTWEFMLNGTPFIEQAVLYNNKNKTFGVADILVRSDWINKLVDTPVLTNDEMHIKAPNLKGNYHYIVIDIKWTTMILCADGKLIRNNDRFPAYKGQLAIYNAAMGILQGYTPNKAYILAKGWKYTVGSSIYQGHNCFDRLGCIDYSTFDYKYIDYTIRAINWVRNMRYNGHRWSCIPPSVSELYPNMNNKYDTPYHKVKRELAGKIDELTQIWMVSVCNREIAHENGIFKWTDPKCTSESMGINGKYVGPLIDEILDINRNNDPTDLIRPSMITNNDYDWQNKKDIDFYVDFETINGVFYDKNINLQNSRMMENTIFMIGIGYEENNNWVYKSFIIDMLNMNNEKHIIQQFVDFIEHRISNYMKKYNIQSRKLCYPTIFHWGNAEKTMFDSANNRHNQIWSNWKDEVNWLDFCKVFRDEPILIKNAMKFNLKDIANIMNNHGFIKTKWDSNGPSCGLNAMIDAAEYYHSIDDNKNNTNEDHIMGYTHKMVDINHYNQVDCKVIWEIVEYLRDNHRSSNINILSKKLIFYHKIENNTLCL